MGHFCRVEWSALVYQLSIACNEGKNISLQSSALFMSSR